MFPEILDHWTHFIGRKILALALGRTLKSKLDKSWIHSFINSVFTNNFGASTMRGTLLEAEDTEISKHIWAIGGE